MKTATVLIDAARRYDIDLPANTNAGDYADQVAREHGIAGTHFTFKANGDALNRTTKLSTCDDGALLELIETTAPAPAPKPATTPKPATPPTPTDTNQ